MSDRVLSTQTAKDAIQQIQSIIDGELQSTVSNLDNQGQTLSDQNNWDGPLATQFRSETWPQVHSTLTKLTQELNQLRQDLAKISQDIFQAGGGA